MTIFRLLGKVIGLIAKLIGFIVLLFIAFIFSTDFLYSTCEKSLKKCDDKNPSMLCNICKKTSTKIKYDFKYHWESKDDAKKD
jgi:hypothetical protein